MRTSHCSTVGRRFPIGNAYSYTVKKGYSYLCMWMTSNWLARNKILIRCGNYSTKKLICENQHLSWIMYTWAALKDNVKKAKILKTTTEPCLNREFPREQRNNYVARKNQCLSSWSYDMAGHAKKCVERYCELANKTTQQLYKVSTPCIDDHHFKEEETKSVRELSNTCSQIVLKCLYLARLGRPDILWSVNKFARSITKWTKACDKRLSRLISYIHHTCEHKQYGHVVNTAKQCTLGLFQDSTPCMDDHQFIEGENESVGDLSTVCSLIVLKCLYLARIGRPDILWSVNKLVRAFVKWRKSCDKRLTRLISYIHHTSEYQQFCYAGNTAQQCRLGLYQDSDFAGDLEDSKKNIRRDSVHFRKSHVRANKLDVQETDFSFTQLYGS